MVLAVAIVEAEIRFANTPTAAVVAAVEEVVVVFHFLKMKEVVGIGSISTCSSGSSRGKITLKKSYRRVNRSRSSSSSR